MTLCRKRALRFPLLYQSPYGERILRDFRWREYLYANPDVAASGPDEERALNHFMHQGYYENRIFDPARLKVLDPSFYRARYPDLKLERDDLAQIHYCYQGYYEDRIPNASTEWLYNADLHVFQMGKVGSHSIAATLQHTYGGKVLHLHWITDIFANFPSCGLPYSKLLVHDRPSPVKVISGMREIVSWTVAGIFQYHGQAIDSYDKAVSLIEAELLEKSESGLGWFDHQYFCSLDVYAHPFVHEAGYTRIEHPGLDLLLYRQEDLPKLEQPLAEFLGLPEFPLEHKNVASEKPNQDIYRRVMRELRIPYEVLQGLYQSRYMRHFCSEEERSKFVERWGGA